MRQAAVYILLAAIGFLFTVLILRSTSRSRNLYELIEKIKEKPRRQIALGLLWTLPIWIYLLLFVETRS